MSFGWDTTLSPESGIFNMNGFPADKKYGTMWHSEGHILRALDTIIQNDIDMVPGNSGSPVYGYYPSADLLIIYGPNSWSVWEDGDEWHAEVRVQSLVASSVGIGD